MNKEGKVELYRFLACVFIMIGHYVYYTGSNLKLPFFVSFQFVEFFFIITGYFTARHFETKWDDSKGFKDVIKYHYKKFIRFVPYTIPAIVGVYAVESYSYVSTGDMIGFWDNLKDIVLELFFLSVFRSSGAHLFVMWFLSAMFVTLPVLIAFFILRKKWLKILIGAILPTMYYVFAPDYTLQEPLNQLLRALCGMMLGGTIYYVTCYIRKKTVSPVIKWLCTILFFVGYISPIVISYNNLFLSYTYIVCFMVWVFVIMADLSVIGQWHSKLLGYMGDISMPIFIWHITIFKFFKAFNICDDNEVLRMILAFVAVITISVINMTIVRLCKKYS